MGVMLLYSIAGRFLMPTPVSKGKAQRARYKHRDMTDLEQQLREKASARIKMVRPPSSTSSAASALSIDDG